MSKLGEMVKRIRTTEGLTQQQVADAGGFHSSLLTRLETGRAKYVRPRDMMALARGLDATLGELWDCIPEANREKRYMGLV